VLLCWRTLRALKAPPWWTAVLVSLGVLAGFYRYIERPELFSLIFLAGSLALILCSREGVWPRWVLFLFVPLIAIWEVLHGAVFGWLILGAVVFAENVLARWLPSAVTEARATWRTTLNWATSATVAMSLIHPHGLLHYGIFSGVITNAAGFSTVSEWGPANLREYWVFFFLLGAGIVGLAWRRDVNRMTEFLWFIGFGILGWRYARATGQFGIAALPWLAFIFAGFSNQLVRRAAFAGALILLAFGIYIHKFSAFAFFDRRFDWYFMEDMLPVGSVRFALDHDLKGPLYNTGHFGGYLAYALYPTYKIYQYNLPAIWGDTYTYDPALVERHGIQWAIIGQDEEQRWMFPRSHWALLFRDARAMLVVRRSPENRDLINQFEVRYFHPSFPVERLKAGFSDPGTSERFTFEAAVYCTYRRNGKVCPLLIEKIQRDGSVYTWSSWWLPQVLKRQSESPYWP
jgi:hypothetical protein